MPFKASQHGESYREPAPHKERNTHIMGLPIWVPQHFPLRFMSWGWFSWKAINGANSPALFCSPSDLLLFILAGFNLLPGSRIPQHWGHFLFIAVYNQASSAPALNLLGSRWKSLFSKRPKQMSKTSPVRQNIVEVIQENSHWSIPVTSCV